MTPEPPHPNLKRPPAVRTALIVFQLHIWDLNLKSGNGSIWPQSSACRNCQSYLTATGHYCDQSQLQSSVLPQAPVMLINLLLVRFHCRTSGIWNAFSVLLIQTNWHIVTLALSLFPTETHGVTSPVVLIRKNIPCVCVCVWKLKDRFCSSAGKQLLQNRPRRKWLLILQLHWDTPLY